MQRRSRGTYHSTAMRLEKKEKKITMRKCITYMRNEAPPGRLGSNFIHLPPITALFSPFKADSASRMS